MIKEDKNHVYIDQTYFIGKNEDIYPLFCGYGKCKSAHNAPGHRPYYLLCCVGTGRGVFRQGGIDYPLKAGWAFLIFPNIINEYIADTEYPWEYSWIGFEGESAIKFLRHTGFSESCPVLDLGSPYVYNQIRNLTDTCNSIDTVSSVKYLYACGCLYDIVGHISHIADEDSFPTGSGISRYIELAIRYMQTKYGEKINITMVAEETGLSREYFSLLFKKETGVSPIDYLLDIRIKRAQYLLSQSDLTVKEIAELTGFEDYHYFSRKFKELSGVSPMVYRKKSRR